LTIGDVFTKKQEQGIEDYMDVPKTQQVTWELDSYDEEHFRSLGLMDEDDKEDDFVSYNK